MRLFENFKKVRLQKRFLLPMLIFPFALALLALLSIFVYSAITFKPNEVKVSNVTAYSATISWVTKAKTKGTAIATTEETKLPVLLDFTKDNKHFDDRDWSVAELRAAEIKYGSNNELETLTDEDILDTIYLQNLGDYNVHHVTLKGLEPETEYSVMIGNGGVYKKVDITTDSNSITTASESDNLYTPEPSYGLIKMWGTEEPITDGVVYLEIENRDSSERSSLISSVLSDNGSWYLDLISAKDPDGEPFLTTVEGDNIEHLLTVETGEYGKFSRYVPLYEDAPVETIFLGEEKESKNPDYELKYLGNSTIDTGPLASLMSLAYAANPECDATRSNKPCSTCVGGTGLPSCEQGITYGANGEVWGPGYMEYCAYRHCTQNTAPDPSCECACLINGQQDPTHWNCADGYDCVNHKCVTPQPTVTEEPAGATIPSTTQYNCADSPYKTQYPDRYDGDFYLLKGNSNATYCPKGDTCKCKCENDNGSPCDPGGTCDCSGATVTTTQYCCDEANGSYHWTDTIEACVEQGWQTTDDKTKCEKEIITDPSRQVCCTMGLSKVTTTYQACYDHWQATSGLSAPYYIPHTEGACPVIPNLSVPDPSNLTCTPNSPCTINHTSNGQTYTFNGTYDENCLCVFLTPASREQSDCEKYKENLPYGYVCNENECPSNKKAILIRDYKLSPQFAPIVTGNVYKCIDYPQETLFDNETICKNECKKYDYFVECVDVIIHSSSGDKIQYRCIFNYDNVKGVAINEQENNNSESQIYYSVDSNSYVVPQNNEGLYSIVYDNQIYTVKLELGNVNYLIYIDQNDNNIYDSEIDIQVASDPIELSFEKVADLNTYNLNQGFNFVSFDFFPETIEPTSEGLLTYLNSEYNNAFYSISKYDTKAGSWNILGSRDGQVFGNALFQVAPGTGYVLRSNQDITVSIPGFKVDEPVPVSLSRGWNLVGLHGASTSYTAQSFIDSTNEQNIESDNVTRWDTSKARYEGLQITPDNNGVDQVYGYDFPLVEQQAYFVRVLQGEGRWTPE